MKSIKIIILCFIILLFSGCSNWKKYIEVDNINNDNGVLKGTFKNKKSFYYDIKYIVKYSGKKDKGIYECYEFIKPNETKEFSCEILNSNNKIVDSSYKLKIKDIELLEVELPKLSYGEIYSEYFKYYFEDINKNHELFLSEFNIDNLVNKVVINYSNDEKININSEYFYNNSNVFIDEVYDVKKNELEELSIRIDNTNEEIENNIINSLVNTTNFNSDKSLIINYINNNIENSECTELEKWCINILREDSVIESITYTFIKNN